MAASTNKRTQTATDNARITGVQKHCMGQASILVESVAYTPAQVIAIYQNDLDALAVVTAARLALSEALAKAKPIALARSTFDRGFKHAILGAYGNSPGTLGDFGIVLTTPKTPSTAVKATAVTQAKATRKLRQTLGKNQKAKIKAPPVDASSALPPPAASGSGNSPTGGATGK